MKQIKKWSGGVIILWAAWILPPIIHDARHLCPVRPDGVSSAHAIPAFARKYGMSCQQCHAGYPVLNSYGRQFKLQGYVRNPGAYEGTLQSEDKELQTEKIFPWGVVVRSRPFDNGKGTISNQGNQMGSTINTATNNGVPNSNPNGFKSQPINDVDFFVAGGDVARKLSWFGELDANTPVGVQASLGDLKLGYHPSQYLHVVAMRRGFFVDDPYQTISSAESPTIANRATDLLLPNQGSLSGNLVTATQQALYAYGQYFLPTNADSFSSPGFIYYAAGAAKDDDLGRQANAPTNGYARLAFDNGSGLMLGTFGTYGHEGPRDNSGMVGDMAGFNAGMMGKQQFVRGGFDTLWEIGDLAARGAFLYMHDGDPSLRGATATDRAAYAELAYYYKRAGSQTPFLVPLIRENWYTTFNGTQQFNYISALLQHYFAPNWKALIEWDVDTKRGYQEGTLINPQLTVAQGGSASRAILGNRVVLQTSVGF